MVNEMYVSKVVIAFPSALTFLNVFVDVDVIHQQGVKGLCEGRCHSRGGTRCSENRVCFWRTKEGN